MPETHNIAPQTNLTQFDAKINILELEDKILKNWDDAKLIKLIAEKIKNNTKLSLLDGPPFVSSENLHIGHSLISIIKSTIYNYYMMNGYNVSNKLGYDCHGLPSEMKANEILGIKTTEDMEKIGIEKYIKTCIDMIKTYSGAWKVPYNKTGRLCNFSNEYKTMDINYMESVWWAVKELYDKGLIYSGFKVMPYSTSCSTVLSNFEAKSNYKEVNTMTLYVKFKLTNIKFNKNCHFVAWTTTPWTLPMNIALCVNPSLTYVIIKVKIIKNNEQIDEYYIVGENALKNIYPVPKKKKNYIQPYSIIDKILGKDLVGLTYEPVFDYYKDGNEKHFKILSDSYVKEDNGTGIVHLSPAFGDDDFKICIKNGIVNTENIDYYCPVDESGNYTNKIYNMAGNYVMDMNSQITKILSSNGVIVKKQEIKHKYPYCWRKNTPLIYKAVSSIFVRVTNIKDKLVQNNNKINWNPEHIGTNIFNNWLNDASDWCISRSRFFGTPLPLWMSDDGEEVICVGSIEELKELSNINVTDLHRNIIDNIEIPSRQGKGMLKRIPDVLDCWFESGCAPFAQLHYPFENSNHFDNKKFMADIVCEGIDQTRGWFYTMSVLSQALFDIPPFKNCIVAGIILDKEGKKISKSLGNFVPPVEILDSNGIDATRLYLLKSPAVKAESLKFCTDDIKITAGKLYQLLNGCKLFLEHYIKYTTNNELDLFCYEKTDNVMDIWILSKLNTLIEKIYHLMKYCRVNQVSVLLIDFIEDLLNWYIKLNRPRFKGNCGDKNHCYSLATLYHVYFTFSKVIAPFTPFMAEIIYSKLVILASEKDKKYSVLLEDYPVISDISVEIENKMSDVRKVVNLVRNLRRQANITSVKCPLVSIKILHNSGQFIQNIKDLEDTIISEVNTLSIDYDTRHKYAYYELKPNPKILGKKYGKLYKSIVNEIKQINQEIIFNFAQKNINEIILNIGDTSIILDYTNVTIISKFKGDLTNTQHYGIDGELMIVIDFKQTEQVKEIYFTRLFIAQIQKMRKNSGLHPWDKITIYYKADSNIQKILENNKYKKNIINILLYEYKYIDSIAKTNDVIVSDTLLLNENNISIYIAKE